MSRPDDKPDLLEELGAFVSSRDADDDRWWAAAQEGDSSALPSDFEGNVEDLRPLESGELDGIAQMLAAQRASESRPGATTPEVEAGGGASTSEVEAGGGATTSEVEAGGSAEVVSLDTQRAARWPWVAGAMAAAAAVGIFVAAPPDTSPLPRYDLVVAGADQAFRGEAPQGAVQRHTVGSSLQVVLRPERRSDAPVAVAVFGQHEGATRKLDLPVERAQTGALRLSGVLGRDVPLTPGRWTLIFVVAEEGTPLVALPAKSGDVQRLTYDLVVVPEP